MFLVLDFAQNNPLKMLMHFIYCLKNGSIYFFGDASQMAWETWPRIWTAERRGALRHGQPPSPTNGANKIRMRHRLTFKRVLMMVALKSPGVNRGFVGKEIGLRTVQKDSAEEPQKEKVMLGDPRQSLVRKTKRC